MRRAFTILEILLAVFILGIGMIMVAAVFPVGAKWTREATEDTVGQGIANNAVQTIESAYSYPNGQLTGFVTPDRNPATSKNTILLSGNPFQLQALPGFINIPLGTRAYAFGSNNPASVTSVNAKQCTYFWTALARISPAQRQNFGSPGVNPPTIYNYDVFILVFKKGDAAHVFKVDAREVPGLRAAADTFIPSVLYTDYAAGVYGNTNPPVTGAVPDIGAIGIGVISGTSFRQKFDANLNSSFTSPPIIAGEKIIVCPPADGTVATPLVYVYSTTMTF